MSLDGPFRFDPEGIQDDSERHRLGVGGLSSGFVRVTTAHLPGATVISSVIEIYGAITSNVPDGRLTYFYMLRGEILFHAGQETHHLRAGDVLQMAMQSPSWMKPMQEVGRNDLPPQVIYVGLRAANE